MMLGIKRLAKALTIAAVAAMAVTSSGCAIHSQAPIKEVAYDFSDADFYDRDYAPSPNYANEYVEYEVAVPVAAPVEMDADEAADASAKAKTATGAAAGSAFGHGHVKSLVVRQPID